MRIKTLVVIAVVLCGILMVSASAALAGQGPVWQITSVSSPTNFAPGGGGLLIVSAVNVGGEATDGSTVTVTDTLPAGLTVGGIVGNDPFAGPQPLSPAELSCTTTTSVASCTDQQTVDTGDAVLLRVTANVGSEVTAASLLNQVSVSGGGAVEAATSNPVTISATPAPPGIAPGSFRTSVSTLQAGAHADLTSTFAFNTRGVAEVSGAPKDVRFDAPVGFVGNTVGLARCPIASITGEFAKPCPKDSIVGTAIAAGRFPFGGAYTPYPVPVYNIAPSPGEPAAFAFHVEGTYRLDTSVLSNGDYGVRVTVSDVSEQVQALALSLTLWGVPADHNGPGPDTGLGTGGIGGPSQGAPVVPLLTNPTQCSEALSATLSSDAWAEPGVYSSQSTAVGTPSGCDRLPFSTSVSMLPDTLQAGAPAGYNFDLNVFRGQDSEPNGIAAADVKNVTVVLPVGTVVSPSSATGLSACTDAQFGLHSGLPGECPREAQIGTVRIKTPALEEALQGQVYLGSPLCSPCTPADAQEGRMVRLFLQASSEGEGGIIVKLEGTATINQQTGQITATFTNNPQLPFSDFKMSLAGGPRATLANPSVCGVATTSADLTPWSAPFTLDSAPSSSFEVTGCPAPQFNPSFAAGTTNDQAGAFSPFTVAFGRTDSDQDLNGLQMRLPAGLLGELSAVTLCKEPQAAQGTCGPESLIGHTQVQTGPGAEPFLVTGGQVFLTESYKGAPFGLSIVVPAKAGPYTLAGTTGTGVVVVRATINVDPVTAALTVTSDPLPTILDGIPLQLKVVNVTIDRSGFTFNPTDCGKLAVGGTLTSTQGTSAAEASSFQVTNCGALSFKPGFAVSTSGKTSRAKGASLDAKLTFPSGSQGTTANIAKVKVDLPKQLPSRLTTLQKACTAATFDANPANCPAASVIGISRAVTPILPVMLTGPAYFVSHGGEAFPDLEIVLQGDGVRVNLTGSTFISSKGITSSTFKTVPDVPISSFELYLPEGKNSALAANGNLCSGKLTMPTAFVAQNGAEIHETTKVAVTGCPKAKQAKAKKAKAKKASPSKQRKAKQSALKRGGHQS